MIAEETKFAAELQSHPFLRDSGIGLVSDFVDQVRSTNYRKFPTAVYMPQGANAYRTLDFHSDATFYFVNKFFPVENEKAVSLQAEIDALQFLDDEWDGVGSGPVDNGTILRAKAFATKLSTAIETYFSKMEFSVGPGPKGSIDFEHNGQDFLLINFPSDSNKSPTFFARKRTGIELKGSIDTENSSLMSLLLG